MFYLICSFITALLVILPGCKSLSSSIDKNPGNPSGEAEKSVAEVDSTTVDVYESTTLKIVSKEETGPLEITLKDAILMGLSNNRAFAVERLAPKIRRTYEEEENAVFDQTLNLDLDGTYRNRPGSDEEDLETDTAGAALGVSRLNPSGTKIGIDLAFDQSRGTDDQNTSRLGLNLTKPLRRGKGAAVNLTGIRLAALDTLASKYELWGYAEYLLAEIETHYWEYSLAEQEIGIFEESLKLAQDQQSETRERIKVGKLPGIELIAAEAEVALRLEALINARSKLKSVRIRLLRLLNPSGKILWGRSLHLKDLLSFPDVAPGDVEDHVKIALLNRPELRQAKLNLQRGDLEIVKTKNGLLPRMDLFISLGKTGYSDSFGDSISEIGGNHYDVSLGLKYELSLGNRSARAKMRRKELSRDKNHMALENLEQLAELDVRLAHIEVKRTAEQVPATGATHRLQKEKLRTEQAKFRVGRSTALLVAQAQRDLLFSEISKIQATAAYLKALTNLYRQEGSLLKRYNIDLAE